jgi:glycosyltransferase involved in cell wall biosynthesis
MNRCIVKSLKKHWLQKSKDVLMAMRTSSSSLIISTYNWPDALKLCLLSVAEQSVLPDEVIVADDGSTTQTAELIEAFRATFPVKLIHVWHEDDGFRLAKIRNKAIAASSCDYIIQIDGDLILHKHFIKDHLKVRKQGNFVAGGRVLLNKHLSDRMLQQKIARIGVFESGQRNILNRFRINWLSRLMTYKYGNQDIFSLRGCNMAFWKEDLVHVNGYNEVFHAWGLEDSEIASRLIYSGLKKRTLKFGGIGFHIFHPEADRSRFQEAQYYLLESVKRRIVYCELGLNQYINELVPLSHFESDVLV